MSDKAPSVEAQAPGMLMTVAELARELGMTAWAIRSMLKRNQVPASCIRKIGHRIRFDRAAVKAWVDALTPA